MNLDVENFVVQIRHYKTKYVYGTGFIVNKSAHVVTCAHVIKRAGVDPYTGFQITRNYLLKINQNPDGKVLIHYPKYDDRELQVTYARVIVKSTNPNDDDLVLLEPINKIKIRNIDIAPLVDAKNSNGNKFVSFGFRKIGQFEGVPAKGTIVGHASEVHQSEGFHYRPLIVESQHIDSGMSGSPIFDINKRAVVGIIAQTIASNGPSAKDRDTAWGFDAALLFNARFNKYLQQPINSTNTTTSLYRAKCDNGFFLKTGTSNAILRLYSFLDKKSTDDLESNSYIKVLKYCVYNEAKYAISHSNFFDFRNYLQISEKLNNKQKHVFSKALIVHPVTSLPSHIKNSYFNRDTPIKIKMTPSLIGAAIIFKYLEIVEMLNIKIFFEKEISASRLRQSMKNENVSDIIILPLTSAHSYLLKTTTFYYIPILQLPRGTQGLVLPNSFRTNYLYDYKKTYFMSLGNLTPKKYFEQLSKIGMFSKTQLIKELLPISRVNELSSIFNDGVGVATFFPFDRIIDVLGYGYRPELNHLEISGMESILFVKEYLLQFNEEFAFELRYWVFRAFEALKDENLLELVVKTLFYDNTFLMAMTNIFKNINEYKQAW